LKTKTKNSRRRSHTHLQFARADTQTKIAKEYVFANKEKASVQHGINNNCG